MGGKMPEILLHNLKINLIACDLNGELTQFFTDLWLGFLCPSFVYVGICIRVESSEWRSIFAWHQRLPWLNAVYQCQQRVSVKDVYCCVYLLFKRYLLFNIGV